MKYILSFFVFLLGLCSSTIFANLNPLTLPPLNNRVVDYSNSLDQTTLAQLNAKAQQVQEKTQTQIAVALIPHREGNELIDIGLKLFRESKLWSAEKNNGLLLIISTQEKKIRIIVGYGLQWDLPDARIYEIIEEHIRPLVNQDDFWWAIDSYMSIIPQYIGADARWLGGVQWWENLGFMLFFFGFFLGFFIGEMIEAMSMEKKNNKKHFNIAKIIPYLLPFGWILFILISLGFAQHIWIGIGTILWGIFSYFIDVNHPRRNDWWYHGGWSSWGFWWGWFWWGGGFSGFGGSSDGWGAGD